MSQCVYMTLGYGFVVIKLLSCSTQPSMKCPVNNNEYFIRVNGF